MTRLMKVLVVEENAIMREKIAGLLSRVLGIDVVNQISDCSKLVEAAADMKPQVLLLDAGVAYRRKEDLIGLQQENGEIRIIVLTENDKALFARSDVAAKVRIDAVINKKDVFDGITDLMQVMARDSDSL